MPSRMIFSSEGETLGSSSGVSRANHHHTAPAITPITALNQKAERQPWWRMNHASSGRRQAAARAHPGEDESVDEPAFLLRHPAGDELVGRRVNHSFAGAQCETDAR